MPKIIALVSTASMPPTTLLWVTYLNPSAIDRNPGLAPSEAGGSGRMKNTVRPKMARHAVSMP